MASNQLLWHYIWDGETLKENKLRKNKQKSAYFLHKEPVSALLQLFKLMPN